MNFNELVKNNQNNIKKIIRFITGENNEDIEQNVYLKVWQKRNCYKEQGKDACWIGTVAKNLSKDYLKSSDKKMQNKFVQDENAADSIRSNTDNPESAFIRKFRQKKIIKAINSLKPKLKEVIIMYEIEGLSYQDIASYLKCPEGTVKSRIYTAKQQLAEQLKDLL